MGKTEIERLDDWDALCAWLEDRPYNASYDPHCRGAYLLTGFYSPQKTITIDDPDQPPRVLPDGRTLPHRKEVPNPNLEKEKEIARQCRVIVKERRRLGVVYWATGWGWRLRKDYKAMLAAERARLTETSEEAHAA